jgi:glutamate-1-semialdehyde aminotransferase
MAQLSTLDALRRVVSPAGAAAGPGSPLPRAEGVDAPLRLRTRVHDAFGVWLPLPLFLAEGTTLGDLAGRLDEIGARPRAAAPTSDAAASRGEASASTVDRPTSSSADQRTDGSTDGPAVEGDTALRLARLTRELRAIAGELEAMGAGDVTGPASPSLVAAGRAASPIVPIPADAVPAQAAAKAPDAPVVLPYRPLALEAGARLTPAQQRHLSGLVERVSARTAGSRRLAAEQRGVFADSRFSAGFHPLTKELAYPLMAERGEGGRLWDVDGNEYVDLTMGFGTLLFGHSPPFLVRALQEQVGRGVLLGPQGPAAGRVAGRISALTGVERATFCNSGTEAVMVALRLARAATGRAKVAVFAGSYHGTFDGLLARAGTRADGRPGAVPVAPGVPPSLVSDVVVLPYLAPESLDQLRAMGGELAAVLVEPHQSRRPEVQPAAFLHALREITTRSGAALVFDEVLTGFRAHPGGVQALYGVRADLVTYGKVVANGLPVGVVAGSARFMDAVDGGPWRYGDDSYPAAPQTVFAGTFFKHPLSMAAAEAVLGELQAAGPALQQELSERARVFAAGVNAGFEREGLPIRAVRFASLLRFEFAARERFAHLFYAHLLERGVYVWEGRTCFLSTAHTAAEVGYVSRMVQESAQALRAGGFLG